MSGAEDAGWQDARMVEAAKQEQLIPPWPCPCGGTLEPQVIGKCGGHVSLRIGGCRCAECHRWVFSETEISRAITVCVDAAEVEIYKQADALSPDTNAWRLIRIEKRCYCGYWTWDAEKQAFVSVGNTGDQPYPYCGLCGSRMYEDGCAYKTLRLLTDDVEMQLAFADSVLMSREEYEAKDRTRRALEIAANLATYLLREIEVPEVERVDFSNTVLPACFSVPCLRTWPPGSFADIQQAITKMESWVSEESTKYWLRAARELFEEAADE